MTLQEILQRRRELGEEEFPEPITPSEVPNAVQQFNLGQQDDFSSGLPVQPPAPPIEEAPLPLDYGGTDWFTGGVPQGPTADLPTMGYAESAPLPLDYGGDDWFSGSDAAPVAAPAIPGPEEVRQRLAEQKRAKATISVMEEDGAPPDALDSIDPKQDYKRTAKRNKVLSQKPEEISALQNFGNAFEVGFKNMTKGDLYYDLIKRDHAEAARYLAKLEADNPTYEGMSKFLGHTAASIIPSAVALIAGIGLAPVTGGGSTATALGILSRWFLGKRVFSTAVGATLGASQYGASLGESYEQEQTTGVDIPQWRREAAGVGHFVAEMAMEAFQLGKVMGEVGKLGKKMAGANLSFDAAAELGEVVQQGVEAFVPGFVRIMAAHGLREVPQEVLTQVAQNFADLLYKPPELWQGAAAGIKEAALGGFVGAAMLGTAVIPATGISYVRESKARDDMKRAAGAQIDDSIRRGDPVDPNMIHAYTGFPAVNTPEGDVELSLPSGKKVLLKQVDVVGIEGQEASFFESIRATIDNSAGADPGTATMEDGTEFAIPETYEEFQALPKESQEAVFAAFGGGAAGGFTKEQVVVQTEDGPITYDAVLLLSKTTGDKTILNHETWHAIEQMGLLDENDLQTLRQEIGTEEESAVAFQKYDEGSGVTQFDRVIDFFRQMLWVKTGRTSEQIQQQATLGQGFTGEGAVRAATDVSVQTGEPEGVDVEAEAEALARVERLFTDTGLDMSPDQISEFISTASEGDFNELVEALELGGEYRGMEVAQASPQELEAVYDLYAIYKNRGETQFAAKRAGREQDSQYMAAVDSKDVKTQQRLVDEAAMNRSSLYREAVERAIMARTLNRQVREDPSSLVSSGEIETVEGAEGYLENRLMGAGDLLQQMGADHDAIETLLFVSQFSEGTGNSPDSLMRQTALDLAFGEKVPQTPLSSAEVHRDDDGNVIPLSERFPPTQDDTQFAAKRSGRDAEQARAYAEGNEEAGKAIAEEAAREAGYLSEMVYHAGPKEIDVFDSGAFPDRGFFFADSKDAAVKFHKWKHGDSVRPHVVSAYLKMENTKKYKDFWNDYSGRRKTSPWTQREYDRFSGFDSQIIGDDVWLDAKDFPSGKQYVILNKPENIKSAEAFTFYKEGDPEVVSGEAEVGELIPVSKRFDSARDETRFAAKRATPLWKSNLLDGMSLITAKRMSSKELEKHLHKLESVQGKGAKAEAEWIGLTEAMVSKKSWTPKELEDFISENQLVIEEVGTGQEQMLSEEDAALLAKLEEEHADAWSEEHRMDEDGIDRFNKLTSRSKLLIAGLDPDSQTFPAHTLDYLDSAKKDLYYLVTSTRKLDGFTQAEANLLRVIMGKASDVTPEKAIKDYWVADPETGPFRPEPDEKIDYEGFSEAVNRLAEDEELKRLLGLFEKQWSIISKRNDLERRITTLTKPPFKPSGYEQHTTAPGASTGYTEIVLRLPERGGDEDFVGDHLAENKNIVGWVRFDIREIDGKKMLFLIEMQSDWHQAGARRGYRGPAVQAELAELAELQAQYQGNTLPEGSDYRAVTNRIQELQGRAGGVPDAPFKKNWHELILKRLLRHAVDEGLEGIAWPGDFTLLSKIQWGGESKKTSRKRGAIVQRYTADTPAFLRRYTKKWGGKVEKGKLDGYEDIDARTSQLTTAQWEEFKDLLVAKWTVVEVKGSEIPHHLAGPFGSQDTLYVPKIDYDTGGVDHEWVAAKSSQVEAEAWIEERVAAEASAYSDAQAAAMLGIEPPKGGTILYNVGKLAVTDKMQESLRDTPQFQFAAKRVTSKQDAEYMAAVEADDVETQQRLVDHMANLWGFTVGRLYHGTKRPFTKFKSERDPNRLIYFSEDKEFARGYPRGTGGHRDPEPKLAAKIEKVRAEEKEHFNELYEDFDRKYPDINTPEALEAYDNLDKKSKQFQRDRLDGLTISGAESEGGIRVVEVYLDATLGGDSSLIFDPATQWEEFIDVVKSSLGVGSVLSDDKIHPEIMKAIKSGSYLIWEKPEVVDAVFEKYPAIRIQESSGEPATTIAVRDPTRIKSADPITRYKKGDPEVEDGTVSAGDVIPLSERFDSTKDDTRFAAKRKSPWSMSQSGEGDLYIKRVGTNAGQVTKERQGPSDIALTVDASVLLPDYMFYLLQSLQPELNKRKAGTAQQAITQRDVDEVLTRFLSGTGAQFAATRIPKTDSGSSMGLGVLDEWIEAGRPKGGLQQEGLPRNPKVIEVAQHFQDRFDEEPIDHRTATPDQNRSVEEILYREAKYANESNPEAAGWYKENLASAMRILRGIDSSISSEEDAFIFKAILAVTSDGQAVQAQLNQSWDTYQHWKRTGEISTQFAKGTQVNNIRKNLQRIERVVGAFSTHTEGDGWSRAVAWLNRTGTVTEMRASLVEEVGFTPDEASRIGKAELVDTVVPFSVIFGPKLGSFFNNLYGDYSTFTMDRWFMRNMGRVTGTGINLPTAADQKKKEARLRKAVRALSKADLKTFGITKSSLLGDGVLAVGQNLARYFQSKENRIAAGADGKEATNPITNEARKAAVNLVKSPMVEAPDGGGHRSWIRDRMKVVQDRLAADGIVLEAADLQALLWYNEKGIYEAAGNIPKKGEDDYAAAAQALHDRLASGPSRLTSGAAGRVGRVRRGSGDRRSPRATGEEAQFAAKRVTSGTTFSGGGLVELGLTEVSKPTFSLEYDADIAKVHDKALGGKTVVADIRKARKQLEQLAGLDHHHSSPPCVVASKQNPRQDPIKKADETAFGRIIAAAIRKYRNPVFTLENVVDYGKTEAYRMIAEALDDVGYTHDAWDKTVYVAADHGSPTTRRRLMVRATLVGKLPEIKKQPRGNWFDPIEDLIDGLASARLSRSEHVTIFRGLDAKGIDPFNIKTPILISGGGQGWTGESVASVVTASEPAFPLVASTHQFSRVVMPDGRVLRLDARAMARITGVPDSYPLPEDDALGRTIIGNGVPPPMVRAIFAPLLRDIQKDTQKDASFAARRVKKPKQVIPPELDAEGKKIHKEEVDKADPRAGLTDPKARAVAQKLVDTPEKLTAAADKLIAAGSIDFNDSQAMMNARVILSKTHKLASEDPNNVDLHRRSILVSRAYINAGSQWGYMGRHRQESPNIDPASNLRRILYEPRKDLLKRLNKAEPNSKEEGRAVDAIMAEHNNVRGKLRKHGLDLDQIDPDNYSQIRRAVQVIDSTRAHFSDKLFEYWISMGLLSGPATHGANILGNTASGALEFLLQQPVEIALSKLQNKKGEEARHVRELKYAGRAFAGSFFGPNGALRNMIKTFRTERSAFEEDWLGTAQHAKVRGGRRGVIGGKTGRGTRIPLRFLQAADDFYKTIYGHMGASMAATRIGIDQGHSGAALEKFIAGEMAKPSSESWRLGLGKSLLLTFQDDPGPLAKGVNIMRENVPGPRWLMPFVTVVGNILNMGFAKSPLGGITLMHKVAQAGMVKYVPNSTVAKSPSDIVLRGQQIQRGLAEQVIAWVFTLALWDFLNDEDDEDLPRLTGSIAPGAERWRQPWMDGVIQPHSIRFKGKYYSYIRLEPIGTTLGLIVDGLVAAQAAKDGKDMNEALGKAFREMSQVALDKTFLYGLSDLMESMRSDKGAMQWAQNFTTSFAPNIVRSSLRAADPEIPSYKITESRTKYPEGVIENLAHRAFPLPKAGPPKKRNIWGKKIDRSASDQPLSSFLIRLVMPVIIMDTKDTRHVDYMILRINEKADSGTLNKRDEPMKPLLMGWPPSNGERRGFGKYEMTRKEYALFIERRGEIAWRMLKNRFSERQILDPGERERQTIMSAFRKATDRARTEYLRGIKR